MPPMSEELSRRMGDLIRLGRVVEIQGKSARVRAGDVETDWIRWPATRAGRLKVWSPPSLDEQVLLFAPEGDIERAVIGPSFFSNLHPAPEEDGSDFIEFEDGGRLSYHPETKVLSVALADGAGLTITAPAGVRIEGDLQVSGDVVAGGVSLTSHTHTGDSGGKTGAPL